MAFREDLWAICVDFVRICGRFVSFFSFSFSLFEHSYTDSYTESYTDSYTESYTNSYTESYTLLTDSYVKRYE